MHPSSDFADNRKILAREARRGICGGVFKGTLVIPGVFLWAIWILKGGINFGGGGGYPPQKVENEKQWMFL